MAGCPKTPTSCHPVTIRGCAPPLRREHLESVAASPFHRRLQGKRAIPGLAFRSRRRSGLRRATSEEGSRVLAERTVGPCRYHLSCSATAFALDTEHSSS